MFPKFPPKKQESGIQILKSQGFRFFSGSYQQWLSLQWFRTVHQFFLYPTSRQWSLLLRIQSLFDFQDQISIVENLSQFNQFQFRVRFFFLLMFLVITRCSSSFVLLDLRAWISILMLFVDKIKFFRFVFSLWLSINAVNFPVDHILRGT